MRVLVTGGAGFIGSHVVDALVAAGHEPRVLDVRRSPYPEHAGVDTVLGDLLDGAQVLAAAQGCEAIAHLAASADVGVVAEEPRAAEALNCRGTFNVLEAARATGARVLYASTIWAYSDVVADEVDEDTNLALPSHFYTATKVAGEMYCKSYGELYGVDSTILRFGIPYGPRARPAAVLPIFVAKALAGDALTIAGDGAQSRRFVYVEDLAAGVVAALRAEAAGRVYNLVGAEDTSVRQIADAVGAVVGAVEVVHTEGRSGDFAGARVSGVRAATELGWRATTPFAEGVDRYVAWVRASTPPAVPTESAVGAPAPASGADGVVAPAAGTRAVAAARRRGGLLVGARALALLAVAVFTVLGYLEVIQAAGVGDADAATVAVVAAVAILCTVGAERLAGVASWGVGALVLIPLVLPAVAHALNVSRLNVPLLVLGAAGAGLVLALIGIGQRAVRGGELDRGTA